MRKLFILGIVLIVILGGWFYWKKVDNAGTKMMATAKTVGKGEYVTVSGKLRRNFFGDFTAGGYKFDPDNKTYWSCVDKSKSRDEIIPMGDYVNSFMYYMRESINLAPLQVTLLTKSKDDGWVQVTGDLDKKKHLFTTTKAVLIYDCPKE